MSSEYQLAGEGQILEPAMITQAPAAEPTAAPRKRAGQSMDTV